MPDIGGLDRDIEWIRESLERIEYRLHEMEIGCGGRHREIDGELAALRVKAGLYGAAAGAAPAIVAVAAIFLG